MEVNDLNKVKVNLYKLLQCISTAQDLVSPKLYNHHQQVAYLSYCLAREMQLPIEQQKDIFLASLVHDIGALSIDERLEVIEEEPLHINHHAFISARLFESFKPLQYAAKLIKYHHLPWEYGKGLIYNDDEVPYGSHVIHIADRICSAIKQDNNVLSQLPHILEHIKNNCNSLFDPKLFEGIEILAKQEYIWLDLVSNNPIHSIDTALFDIIELGIDDNIELGLIFSQIIDFRSSFTARHSAGVANIAECLAQLAGFSNTECKMMLVAGYLHDLGKLAIDNSILEKPSALTDEEFNMIRSHTYYTYRLLDTIPQFKLINLWASYHHERMDGNGYPFHIKGENLSLGSRIMAVSDVFTAIMESRPYREGMTASQAVKVLRDMVDSGALDQHVVKLLLDNFSMINDLREKSQQEAEKRYESFLKI